MGRYDDIINTPYPLNNGRVRMPMDERAKIFLPFAALKGFEEAVERSTRRYEGEKEKREEVEE